MHPASPSPRLLDLVRARIRFKHYSIRTEQAYVDWIRRFIRFNGNRHPSELGPTHIEAFLSHLAVDLSGAASTENQAQSALLFLYREVLAHDLPWLDNIVRAKAPIRLPVVLTVAEVRTLLNHLAPAHRLFGELLYGTGMRITEAARLRIKDIDTARDEIVVRNGKGGKDRVTMLPQRVVPALRRQLAYARRLHEADLRDGLGAVWLPPALARKDPTAARDWCWQYAFPAQRRTIDPRNGIERRHHVSDQAFQRASPGHAQLRNCEARNAADASPFICHAPIAVRLRHRTVQELLGHSDVTTTMIYTHVLNRGGRGVINPLDNLASIGENFHTR